MTQPIRVLLADDHPMFLEGVRNALQRFEQLQIVAECIDGPAIETSLKNTPVDVAVLDINMPGKDGLEMARLIRGKFTHVRIIFLTMYLPQAINADHHLKTLVDGYVLKNSGSDTLLQAIETVFRGKPYFDPKLSLQQGVSTPDTLPVTVKLSSREKQIIRLVMEGKGNREIAQELFLSELTIKTHRKNIYEKLGIRNVAELLQAVQRFGIRLNEEK